MRGTDRARPAAHAARRQLVPKPVVQQEPTGCAIASVAAIVGVTYAKARSIANSLGLHADDRALYSATAHMRKLLAHFGLAAIAGQSAFRSWDALPDLALLAIKWHLEHGAPCWHWVVFVRSGDRAYVLDSNKSLRRHRRTDFGRMRPRWFMRVCNSSGH